MAKWYKKYLKIFEKAPEDGDEVTYSLIRKNFLDLEKRSKELILEDKPLVTIAIIGFNEEKRIAACLWSLSDLKSKYPVEFICVDNNSTDRTAEIIKKCGVNYLIQPLKGPGHARQLALSNAKGQFFINIDSDTLYPPTYVDYMISPMIKKKAIAVYSLWNYIPDANHPAWFMKLYITLRNIHLWIQHFKRPEMCVRGMVFAHKTKEAQEIGIKTNIKRGEDGSLAFRLNKMGPLYFKMFSNQKPVTSYGTLSADGSVFNSLWVRIKKYSLSFTSYFTKKDKYIDEDSNLL